MASAMRAWGDRNPKAILVRSRIRVLTDSVCALDMRCSMEVRIPVRWLRMLRASLVNAGMRHREAQDSHWSMASVAWSGAF